MYGHSRWGSKRWRRALDDRQKQGTLADAELAPIRPSFAADALKDTRSWWCRAAPAHRPRDRLAVLRGSARMSSSPALRQNLTLLVA